ncbi:MAG: V-type ATP synthase subunit E family protein [candidate division WOR-3 bacterium]
MGLSELIGKIRAEGQVRVAQIEKEKNEEIGRIERRVRDDVAKLEEEYRARVERETRLIIERAMSRARLEQRKALLSARWGQIDRVLSLAAERIVKEEDYPELVRGVVERFARKDSVVRFSKADATRFTASPGMDGEPAEISGGVIIEQGRVVLDFSVDRALVTVRFRLASELGRILFPADVV